MDLTPSYHQEATASTSSTALDQDNVDISAKPLRSSARVKAAKQKSQEKNQDKERDLSTEPSSSVLPAESSRGNRANKRTREQASGKGKAKEILTEEPRRRR